jgi:ribonuclease P protein subunit RPR2
MGKKNKDETPNPNGVVNRDILQRLNFLYQASAYLESISRKSDAQTKPRVDSPMDTMQEAPADASGSATPSLPSTERPKAQSARRERQRKRRVIQAADIGQGYVRAMRLIGQKTTVKMYVLSSCNMHAV